MKMLIGAIGIVILLSAIVPNAMASEASEFAAGYHQYPKIVQPPYTAAYGHGWSTAELVKVYKMVLKETPSSYAEGWIAGFHHTSVKSWGIPIPPGHTAGWIHGFTAGYGAPKLFGDGFIAGHNAYLNNMNYTALIQGHTQQYRDGFNAD